MSRQLGTADLNTLRTVKKAEVYQRERGGWLISGKLKGGSPPLDFYADSDTESESYLNFYADSDSNNEDDDDFEMSDNEDNEDEMNRVNGDEMNIGEVDKKQSSRKLNPLPPIVYKKKEREGLEVECERFVKCACDNKCSKAVEECADKFDMEVIKKKFIGENLTETKNILLSYLNAQADIIPDGKECFCYQGHLFCIAAFSNLTGVSQYILKKVVE